MLINEVQYKVGLSKKSIRYYEEEGLLNPKRNHNNDYREYDNKDIQMLRIIKFLRELNVSINDIKKLKNGELSLKECMEERIKKIKEMENSFYKVKNMCQEIKNKEIEFKELDISKYSEEMNVLNKRGVTLKDYKKSDQKKILGACLSSLVFSTFFIFFIVLFTVIALTDNSFPFPLYIFFCIIFGFPVLGIIVNLVKRIKEIKGGEENEASKY